MALTLELFVNRVEGPFNDGFETQLRSNLLLICSSLSRVACESITRIR